eukprot:Gb_20356 [translate_table: standard]
MWQLQQQRPPWPFSAQESKQEMVLPLKAFDSSAVYCNHALQNGHNYHIYLQEPGTRYA